jgi:heat shock protein HtpX
MNIYKNIKENIYKTWLLFFTVFILFLIFGWLLSYIFQNRLILYIAIILGILNNFLSYWYSDKIVIYLTGAKKIERKDYPEIYNIVENLCITAGIKNLPKIYILETPALNAFATGRNEKNAAIVLTSGILKVLNKSELEGVIAHELSHIINKDILVGTFSAIVVSIFAILADFTLRGLIFFQQDERKKEINPIVFILFIFGVLITPIVAQLIHLAISRQREFLADSSGVLLTRYPEGLASALLKISKNPYIETSPNFAHLFIENPIPQKSKTPWYIKIWLTHPPIEERIERLMKQ